MMISTNPLAAFHQWLLAPSNTPDPSRTVVIHGDPRFSKDQLIEEIADYLNEYDDDGAGRWLAATSALVIQISEDPGLRKLLRMDAPCPNCPPTGPCGIRKTLTALGLRGHVVFRSDIPEDKTLKLPEAFHAGIGPGTGKRVKCHLVLDPDLVRPKTMAHIVSDVFLDWRNAETRGITPGTGLS